MFKLSKIRYKARGICLRDGRNYGEYCSDFIEQSALELYHLGKLPKEIQCLVEERNPRTKIFRKRINKDVKSQWSS